MSNLSKMYYFLENRSFEELLTDSANWSAAKKTHEISGNQRGPEIRSNGKFSTKRAIICLKIDHFSLMLSAPTD